MHWSFGEESLPGSHRPGLIPLIPWSPVSRLIIPKLNFDQSQTYLRAAMWNPLGAAVCTEADCDIGRKWCLAAAACDRAGSPASNSIMISPFKSSAVLHDNAQQWNLTSSAAANSSIPFCTPFLSASLSRSLSVISVKSAPPLLFSSIFTGFLAKSRPLHWSRFSQAP